MLKNTDCSSREPGVSSEDLGSRTWQLTAVCKSRFREPDTLTQTYMKTKTTVHKINKLKNLIDVCEREPCVPYLCECLEGDQREHHSLGVAGGCEFSDISAKNQTQVFCMSRKCS